MKNHWGQSVGFSFRAALWFRWPVILVTRSFLRSMLEFDLLAIFTVKCNDSVSFSFWSPCFFFFVKDQIAYFQLKQIIVFLNLVFRFIAWLRPSLIIEFSTTGSELYCMQLIVWTLNMNNDRKNKAVMYHADISKRYFSVCRLKNRVLLFAWIKAKVKE